MRIYGDLEASEQYAGFDPDAFILLRDYVTGWVLFQYALYYYLRKCKF